MKKTLLTYTAQKTCTVLLALFVTLAMLALLISCDQDQVQDAVTEYTTPTIKGIITIPEGSDVAPEDIYVKVIDSNDNTVTIQKANADKTFVVQNLDVQMKYKILFTSQQPEFTNAKGLTAQESTTATLPKTPKSKSTTETKGVGGWIENVVPAIKEGNNVGQVFLKPLGTIKGKALIDDATEHYDITIYIPGTSYIAKTTADGSFAIYNVPEGTYTLRYTLEDHVPLMLNDIRLVCPDNTDNPEKIVSDVTLISNVGELEGYVLLDGQTDNTGISIKLESSDKATSYNSTTSSNGYFKISSVKPGSYKVIMSYTNYIRQETNYFDVKEATITALDEKITLFKNVGTIEGTVKLSGEITDFSGIGISITSLDGGNNYTAITDANGGFTKKVKPGKYNVTASYAGYGSQTLEITVSDNSTTKANFSNLTLSSGSVAGFVILEGVTDYSGVTITLADSADKTNVFAEISAADGSFRITGIKKSGTYLLTYSKNGYVTNLSNSIDVTVGSVATASSVTLKSIMSTISGKIQLEGASSHENTTILLKNETNQYTATTDQKGEYKINRVLPGTYTLMASKDGYVIASTNEFVVESSTEKEVELLSLSVAIRSIVGKVTLELGSDYAGALVTATNLSDSTLVYSAISNSEGDYTLAGMKPGEYQIVISYTGYRTETLPTVNVVSSTVTTIAETKMSINRGTITGVAKLDGRSSSEGIKVELLRGSSVYETTTTDESGNYSLYVPQGNYTGVRYSYTDYASTSIAKDIALFADNYVSMGNETLTATHNSVYGTVDVLTTDDESAVTISFDNVTTIEKVVTEAGGSFQFDHVPVGSYTLRFQRQDCSDITIPVEVKAADGINLGKVEITPNTATIKGKVNLENGTSLANVKVSVDLGTKVLETLTDDSGRYEIGGVSIADEYTVSYSKKGWDTSTQQISPKLNVLEIRELDEITLLDTTAPVLSSVIINSGANTTANKNVTLNLTASDIGSGLDKIMVTYDNVFDKGTRQYDYSAIFSWELPAENGVKTIYVRVVDRAGNESASFTTSVTLTDQKTEVSGTMLGENLIWTKEKSPYLVSGTVVVKKGTTLTIEPGVDVQFAGNYGITVEGTIKAIGTETEKISFYGIGEGENNWLGINGRNDNLSMLKYVDIQGTTKGLQGKMTVFDSKINTNQFALYNFSGEVNDSDVNGNVYTNCGTLLNNRIILASFESSFTDSLLTGNVISGNNEQVVLEGVGENNSFANLTVNMTAGIKNCTFSNCTVSFNEGSYYSCVFDGCSFGNFKPAIIRDSNFINFDTINISSSVNTYEEFDLTSNFWGYVNTRELDERGVERVHSFMVDYFSDSESSITKGNIANYRSVPNDEAGYKGSSYYSYPSESTIEYKIGDDGPAGGKVFYDKGYYSNGWRYLECSIEKITNGQYFGYYRSTNSSVNMVLGTSGIIGSGKLNTEIFYLGMGEEAFITESVALKSSEYGAKACSKYVYGGYDDWFMPSKNEINLIFMNRSILALSIFDYGTYWASSERSAEQGWEQVMDNGSQWCWPDRHTTGHDIIAIRAF